MKVEQHNSNTLLIIDKKGVICRIFTPFFVQCVEPIESIKLSEFLEVEGVFANQNIPLIYQIKGKLFAHYYFVLV